MDEAASLHEVVVGVDGSAGARAALDWALREARLRDLAIRLVTVWPEDAPWRVLTGAVDPSSAHRVEEDLRARMRAWAASPDGPQVLLFRRPRDLEAWIATLG